LSLALRTLLKYLWSCGKTASTYHPVSAALSASAGFVLLSGVGGGLLDVIERLCEGHGGDGLGGLRSGGRRNWTRLGDGWGRGGGEGRRIATCRMETSISEREGWESEVGKVGEELFGVHTIEFLN